MIGNLQRRKQGYTVSHFDHPYACRMMNDLQGVREITIRALELVTLPTT